MAVGFLRKWFGPGQPASEQVRDAQKELERAAVEKPSLAGPLSWLREILPYCLPDESVILKTPIDAATAQARLARGEPLLRGETLLWDEKTLAERWSRFCRLLGKSQKDPIPDGLVQLPLGERLAALAAMAIDGQSDSLLAVWEKAEVDAALAGNLLRFTLFPFLAALDRHLAPLREGSAWTHGYCPTCGGCPSMAEFRGLDQSRFLRCGLCTASWAAARLFCPYCETRDHEKLGYLVVEGDESAGKAAACDNCHGYVKTLSTLSALSPLALLVAEATTLQLDLIAAERGYGNPA